MVYIVSEIVLSVFKLAIELGLSMLSDHGEHYDRVDNDQC